MYRFSYFNRYCSSQKLSDVKGKFFENFVCLEVTLEIFVPLTVADELRIVLFLFFSWAGFVYP